MKFIKLNRKSIGFKIAEVIIPIMIVSSLSLTIFSYYRTRKEIIKVSEEFLMQIAKDKADVLQRDIRGNSKSLENILQYVILRG